jgi:hypothetical protein
MKAIGQTMSSMETAFIDMPPAMSTKVFLQAAFPTARGDLNPHRLNFAPDIVNITDQAVLLMT